MNVPVLAAAGGLVAFSVIFIFSASFHAATREQAGFAKMQIVWIAISIAVSASLIFIRPESLRAAAPWIYCASLGLLIAVFFIGTAQKGAARWIVVGPMRLQPSECSKLATILMLAWYLSANVERARTRRGLMGAFLVSVVPLALILKEPDLGTALLFIPTTFAVLFAAGAKKRHLALAAAVMLALLPLGWRFVLKPYQKCRLLAFLNPEEPQRVMEKFLSTDEMKNVRFADSYQLRQALTAIGSGGVWGKGWRRGTQNTLGYLPERHTDFIFAVIAEEWGLFGCLFLLGLLFLLIIGGAETASRAPDNFARLATVGIITMIGAQAAVNIGMNVGLLPITGVTLPFVSYGGSSMFASLVCVFIILNFDLRLRRSPVCA